MRRLIRFFGALCVALLFCVSGYAQLYPITGVFGLKLGMSRAQVRQVFDHKGWEIFKEDDTSIASAFSENQYNSGVVFNYIGCSFVSGRLARVYISGPEEVYSSNRSLATYENFSLIDRLNKKYGMARYIWDGEIGSTQDYISYPYNYAGIALRPIEGDAYESKKAFEIGWNENERSILFVYFKHRNKVSSGIYYQDDILWQRFQRALDSGI